MSIEARLDNLEKKVEMIIDKLVGIASFENMIIAAMNDFKEQAKNINLEAIRLARLFDK